MDFNNTLTLIDSIITDVSSVAVEGNDSSVSAFQIHRSEARDEQECSAI
jgi:hypothetical protein